MIVRKDADQYTCVPNETLCDEALSLEARALLGFLLTKPDDWELNVAYLVKHCHCGRGKIYKMLRELQASGYAALNRDKTGHVEWFIYNLPQEDLKRAYAQKHPRATEKPRVEIRHEGKNLPKTPAVEPYVEIPHEENPHEEIDHVLVSIESLDSLSRAHARVAKDKPKEPVSTLTEKNNGAESFRPISLQSPQAWAQYFAQRLGHRPGNPLSEKEQALFERWIAKGVTLEEVEKAIERIKRRSENKGAPVPLTPLYYERVVDDIRWERKNPAPKGAAPDKNKRYKKQAPDYDSFQQPSQHAFKEYTPEKVTPSSPETVKSYLTKLTHITS